MMHPDLLSYGTPQSDCGGGHADIPPVPAHASAFEKGGRKAACFVPEHTRRAKTSQSRMRCLAADKRITRLAGPRAGGAGRWAVVCSLIARSSLVPIKSPTVRSLLVDHRSQVSGLRSLLSSASAFLFSVTHIIDHLQTLKHI